MNRESPKQEYESPKWAITLNSNSIQLFLISDPIILNSVELDTLIATLLELKDKLIKYRILTN